MPQKRFAGRFTLPLTGVRSLIHAEAGRRVMIGGVVVLWVVCLASVLDVQLWTPSLDTGLRIIAAVTPANWHIDAHATPALAEKIVDKLLLLLTGVIPVLLLEASFVGYAASSLRRLTVDRSASGLYDLGIFALGFFGLWRLWTVLGTLGAGYLAGWLGNGLIVWTTGRHIQIDTGSIALNAGLYALAFTFFDYWTHRIFHSKPFWHLHRMHHSATEMTVISLFRNHPGVALVEPFTRLWPLSFFAAPPSTVLTFAYLMTAYEFLIHSDVRWNWGWFGRWVLLPPLAHRMHHSVDKDRAGTMLGITPVWDRLFGTWRSLDAIRTPLGVTDAAYHTGHFLQEVWRDLAAFGRDITAMMLPGTRSPHRASQAPTQRTTDVIP